MEEVIVNHLVYEDFIQSENESFAFKRMLEENKALEMEMNLFLCLLPEEKRLDHSNKKRKEKNDDDDDEDDDSYSMEEHDLEYETFLKNLKEDGNSYVLNYEIDGSLMEIKYEEEDTISDEDCDLDEKKGFSLLTGNEGDESLDEECEPESINALKEKNELSIVVKIENVEMSYGEIIPSNGFGQIVQQEDGHFSDVEIFDSYYELEGGNMLTYEMDEGNLGNLSVQRLQFKFRQQVLNEMRKPYNMEEYLRLKREIEIKKPEERHMESRNGRERRYSFNKLGKSHLDHHPDLRGKLAAVRDDRRKCLKILRGYFFWLQKMPHGEVFEPWQDPECLAVVEEEAH